MAASKYIATAVMFLIGAAPAPAQSQWTFQWPSYEYQPRPTVSNQWPSYQYPPYPTSYAYPFVPSLPVHPYVPTTPPEWSYNPYTSGLGPCPQRLPGDDPCKETMQPSYGQPSYWPR